MSRIIKSGTIPKHMPHLGECWQWNGAHSDGYGFVNQEGRGRHAHTVMYEITIGPIPKGHGVLHHCDNRGCPRPSHLFTGTDMDNTIDKIKKGRGGKRHGWPPAPGSKNGNAKLTENQVRDIRHSLARGINRVDLARTYHVSPALIWSIDTGKSWRHVI